MNQLTAIHAQLGRVANQEMSLFDSLVDGAIVIDSASLEEKMPLVGVPMVITRVTYRPKGAKQERGYVSVEAVIADERRLTNAIRRGWIPNVSTLADFPFTPEEKIVFNDGSTGIRRQLTMVLHASGALNIGAFDDGDNSAFDRDWTEWDSFSEVGTQKVNDAEVEIPDFQGLQIFAQRGLRVSHYDMDGQEATTFYLA